MTRRFKMCRRQRRSLPLLLIFASIVWFAWVKAEAIAQSESTTGLEGVISEGPIVGGPSNRGLPETRPLASAEFVVRQEKRVVSSIKTDKEGKFRIALPPGHYTVARQGGDGGCSFEVEVAAGEMKKVKWTCDTGRR